MRALQAAALLLAACALAALPATAAARRRGLLAAAANPVAPQPVRVGMASSDSPPLSEWVDGQPTGFEALLLDALAREAGFEPQVRAGGTSAGGGTEISVDQEPASGLYRADRRQAACLC